MNLFGPSLIYDPAGDTQALLLSDDLLPLLLQMSGNPPELSFTAAPQRLTTQAINLGPEISSWLLLTVEMIVP